MSAAGPSIPPEVGRFSHSEWPMGGGVMGELIRSFDWKTTPLGPREAWPICLRVSVELILGCQFPIAILWGPDLNFVYNDAYRAIAGNKHPGALGRAIREVWPEVWTFHQPIFAAVMARGETVNLADQLFRIDRSGSMEETYFTLCYSPIRTQSGPVGGTMVVLLETTQRLGMERELRQAKAQLEIQLAALRQSEERLRLFIEHSPSALAMFDSGMRYLAVSRRWRSNYNLAENIVGQLHYDVFPNMPERWRAAHRRGLAGEVVRCEEDRFEHADGRVQWARYELRPWYAEGGAIGGIIIFSEDITARKQAEQALQLTQRRFELACRSAHTGTWDWDLTTQELQWSRELFTLFGLDPDQDRATFESWSQVLHAEDRDAAGTRIMQAIQERIPLSSEYRVVHPDGSVHWIHAVGDTTYDPSGTPVHMTGLCTDITARKQEEETLRKKNEELSSALAHVRTLRGLLPICSGCKKIRADKNYWEQVEVYFTKHTEAQFSHGYCPDCLKKYFPGIDLTEIS